MHIGSHRTGNKSFGHAIALAVLMLLMPSARASAEQTAPLDFDAAMRGLGFDPAKVDGNLDAGSAGNGILDADEMALVAAILTNPSIDLRAAGGVDPKVKAAGQTTTAAKPADTRKTLGIVLYPGFEVLDVFGPLEMWAYVPDFKVVMIAEQAGPVKSGQQGVTAVADFSFATAPPLDILMVPGGFGTRAQLQNETLLTYLREQHQRTEFTTSVCTGSALLAKAGILKGHKATSNKGAFALAVAQDPSVDWIVKARWVEDGKIFTSSGVSAGTDMALGLVSRIYGKDRARALARSLEYEWHEDPTVDPFAISAVPQPPKP